MTMVCMEVLADVRAAVPDRALKCVGKKLAKAVSQNQHQLII